MWLAGMASDSLSLEKAEQQHPTPPEWRTSTRNVYRRAEITLRDIEEKRKPFIDWGRIGDLLKDCLVRLEDDQYEGKGLVVQGVADGGEAEELLIPEVGEVGFDVDAKSDAWKMGYHDVLMLSAKAAEHLDNAVRDTKRNIIFPREVMIGPSNPDHRPVPVYMKAAPREEDCEKPYPPPETFYMKILTTKGFTTKQKLEAAEGYAHWLDYKGLHDSAEEMYRWGLDIAKAALPNALSIDNVLNSKSNVIQSTAKPGEVSSNLLRATSSLGVHYARTGNIASALPILLSVLRARRNAPVDPVSFLPETPAPEPTTDIGAAISTVKHWFTPPAYPPPPPTGDTSLTRTTAKPTCDESELMLYIGEILFASSPDRASEGVGWTRQGVLIAEANLQNPNRRHATNINELNGQAKDIRRCKQCLLTGVQNWEIMLQRLSEGQAISAEREGGRDAGWLEWKGWFGRGGGVKGKTLDELSFGVLEEELKHVGRLRERITREDIELELNSGAPQVWVGF